MAGPLGGARRRGAAAPGPVAGTSGVDEADAGHRAAPAPAAGGVRVATELAESLAANLGRALRGKPEAVRLAVVALLSGGHLLVEDVPGMGKTLLAKALARSLDGTFARIQATPDLLPTELDAGTVYTVVSRRPRVTEAVLREPAGGAPTPPGFTQRYTRLPEVPERVRELAARVTAGAPGVYDQVRALERWMGENLTYTLDIPPLPEGADAVEQFLFVDKKGFCEQIATALVVMLRSLGVPVRLTMGYTPGERDPFTGLYQVRARNAHAWAEVYFPGVGWQGFDPTASVPLSGEASAPGTARGVASFLGERLPSVPGWAPRAGVAAAGALAAAAAVMEARSWRRRRAAARARSWAEACLDRLDAAGAGRGRPRAPWEATGEYARALSASGLDHPGLPTVVGVLQVELFSGQPVGEEQRRLAEAVVDEVVAGAGGIGEERPAPGAGMNRGARRAPTARLNARARGAGSPGAMIGTTGPGEGRTGKRAPAGPGAATSRARRATAPPTGRWVARCCERISASGPDGAGWPAGGAERVEVPRHRRRRHEGQSSTDGPAHRGPGPVQEPHPRERHELQRDEPGHPRHGQHRGAARRQLRGAPRERHRRRRQVGDGDGHQREGDPVGTQGAPCPPRRRDRCCTNAVPSRLHGAWIGAAPARLDTVPRRRRSSAPGPAPIAGPCLPPRPSPPLRPARRSPRSVA